jgi:hypothetical protein
MYADACSIVQVEQAIYSETNEIDITSYKIITIDKDIWNGSIKRSISFEKVGFRQLFLTREPYEECNRQHWKD